MQHQLLRLSFLPLFRLVPVPKTPFFDSCPCLRPPFFGLYPCLRPPFFGLCPCLRPPFLDVLRHTPTSIYRECPPPPPRGPVTAISKGERAAWEQGGTAREYYFRSAPFDYLIPRHAPLIILIPGDALLNNCTPRAIPSIISW